MNSFGYKDFETWWEDYAKEHLEYLAAMCEPSHIGIIKETAELAWNASKVFLNEDDLK